MTSMELPQQYRWVNVLQSVVIASMVALNLIPTDNQWIYYDDINGVATAIQVGKCITVCRDSHYGSFKPDSHGQSVDILPRHQWRCHSNTGG